MESQQLISLVQLFIFWFIYLLKLHRQRFLFGVTFSNITRHMPVLTFSLKRTLCKISMFYGEVYGTTASQKIVLVHAIWTLLIVEISIFPSSSRVS